MTMTKENIIDRDSLQEAYINMIVDGMDWKTMEQFVYDTIDANLDNCLLYTSPSPRDVEESRMPSSA